MLAVVIAVLIQAMMRGWRRRAERQAELIGTLPPLPDTVGPAIIPATKGLYVGSTLVPNWNDRIAVGDLGYRDQGRADPLSRGNHVAAQRGAARSGFPTSRSPRSAPSAVSRERP